MNNATIKQMSFVKGITMDNNMSKDNELVKSSSDPYPGWPPKPEWIPEQLQDDVDSNYTDMKAPPCSTMTLGGDSSSSSSIED